MKPKIRAGLKGALRRHELVGARDRLISAIAGAIATRDLSQVRAAALCGTDQPTLSKVLRGKTASVTLDKLCLWALALGCTVNISVASPQVRLPTPGEAVRP